MSTPFSDGIDSDPVEVGSESDATETNPTDEVVGDQPTNVEEKAEEVAEEPKLEDLPEKWQQHIKDLRRENARRRTEAKAEPDDVLAERLAAVEKQLEAAEAKASAATKEAILASRGLPPKFIPMIVGTSAEEWEAAADSLVELRGTKGASPDPAQAAASNNHSEMSEKERAAGAFFAGLNK